MKKTLAILIAASAFNVSAENVGSIDLSVTGRIDPSACELDMSGGGNIDYGLIDKDTLTFEEGVNGGSFAPLPVKEINFSIRCSANAAVKISAVSQRLGTVAGGTENTQGFAPLPISLLDIAAGNASNGVAGLGQTSTGLNIGGYIVRYKEGSLNISTLGEDNEYTSLSGDEVHTIYYNPNTQSWRSSGGNLFSNNLNLSTSFAKASEQTPLEAAIFDGTLQIQGYINKEAADLGATKPVLLDGLSTIELNYI